MGSIRFPIRDHGALRISQTPAGGISRVSPCRSPGCATQKWSVAEVFESTGWSERKDTQGTPGSGSKSALGYSRAFHFLTPSAPAPPSRPAPCASNSTNGTQPRASPTINRRRKNSLLRLGERVLDVAPGARDLGRHPRLGRACRRKRGMAALAARRHRRQWTRRMITVASGALRRLPPRH